VICVDELIPRELDRRWPHWLYEAGVEPDPRFSLANERTFLSWIRTSLSVLAAGVAVEALNAPLEHHLRSLAAFVLVLLSFICTVQSWLGWLRSEHAIRNDRPLPGPMAGGVLAGGLLVSGALILAGLVLK
jgi:putative membrane protein